MKQGTLTLQIVYKHDQTCVEDFVGGIDTQLCRRHMEFASEKKQISQSTRFCLTKLSVSCPRSTGGGHWLPSLPCLALCTETPTLPPLPMLPMGWKTTQFPWLEIRTAGERGGKGREATHVLGCQSVSGERGGKHWLSCSLLPHLATSASE